MDAGSGVGVERQTPPAPVPVSVPAQTPPQPPVQPLPVQPPVQQPPAPEQPLQQQPPAAEPERIVIAAVPAAVPAPRAAPQVRYGDLHTRRPAAIQAVRDAEGPALVVTSDPTVWAETKDARAKLGPVLVYDPGHLCDTPARLHWSPTMRLYRRGDRGRTRCGAAGPRTPPRPHRRGDGRHGGDPAALLAARGGGRR